MSPPCQSPAKSSQPCSFCVCVHVCVCQSVRAKPDQYELINRRRQLEGPWGRLVHTWCMHTHTHTHTCSPSLYSILSFSLYLLSHHLACLFLHAPLYSSDFKISFSHKRSDYLTFSLLLLSYLSLPIFYTLSPSFASSLCIQIRFI